MSGQQRYVGVDFCVVSCRCEQQLLTVKLQRIHLNDWTTQKQTTDLRWCVTTRPAHSDTCCPRRSGHVRMLPIILSLHRPPAELKLCFVPDQIRVMCDVAVVKASRGKTLSLIVIIKTVMSFNDILIL